MSYSQYAEKKSFLKEYKGFLAGSIGGIAQVLSGQPFDIVKVRIQSSSNPNISMGQVINQLVKQDGLKGFYKGTTAPLISISAYVSIQFGIFEKAKQTVKNITGNQELTLQQLALCSALAGYGSSFISAPVEHIRIRMQTAKSGQYSSTLHCIRSIYAQNGIRGIYKGFLPTQMRDVIANIFYFMPYNIALQKMKNPEKGDRYLTMCQLCAGGLAGITAWTSSIPIDVIKSKLQADSLKKPKYTGLTQCAKITYKELGMSGFFKGIVPCLIRAVFVNASTFGVYEQAVKLIEKYE